MNRMGIASRPATKTRMTESVSERPRIENPSVTTGYIVSAGPDVTDATGSGNPGPHRIPVVVRRFEAR